jgi:hypothetical protein
MKASAELLATMLGAAFLSFIVLYGYALVDRWRARRVRIEQRVSDCIRPRLRIAE